MKSAAKPFLCRGVRVSTQCPCAALQLGNSTSTSTYLPSKREQSNSLPTHRQTHFSLLNHLMGSIFRMRKSFQPKLGQKDFYLYPVRDLNPCYRRERAAS